MPELVALSYADETVARQAADELVRQSDHLPFDPDALAVIICERNGNYQLLSSRHPGATVPWVRFWGGLIEVLTNEAEPSDIDPEFRRQLAGLMMPGTSTMLTVVSRTKANEVLNALSHFDGASISCALDVHRLPELGQLAL